MKILAGIFGVILVGVVLWLGFNWGQGQTPQSQPAPVPSAGPAVKVPSETPAEVAKPSLVSGAVANAVISQDFLGLKNLMTEPVGFILYATECCGSLTRDEAVGQLSYLNGANSAWNFDESNPVATQLQAADPANFGDSVVGTTSDHYVVAFHVNAAGKIDRIFVSADYKLITQ